MAPVDGTITLDDKPLEGATVKFTPKEGGRPSYGKTDADGYYELVYTQEQEGAEIGDHTVSITTYSEGAGGYGDAAKATPEKVPAKYNAYSELTATVPAGGDTVDFALDSKGEIVESGGYGGGGYGGGAYGGGGYQGYGGY